MKNLKTYFRSILASSINIGLMLILVISSCDADIEVDQTVQEIQSTPPTITGFSPESVEILGETTITGTNLQFVDVVKIGDQETKIVSRVSDTQMVISINPSITSGKVTVINQVSVQGGDNLTFETTSTESLIILYPEPTISSDTPTGATVNEIIDFEGSNLDVVSRITFGDIDGIVQLQEDKAIVVQVPDPGLEGTVEVKVWYFTNSGEVSQTISDAFIITVPVAKVNTWPRIIFRDMGNASIFGANMNLITSVTLGDQEATIIEENTVSNLLSFTPPSGLETGIYDLTIIDKIGRESTQAIPYINGEYWELVDFDTKTADIVSVDLGKDEFATVELINDPNEQPVVEGTNTPFGKEHLKVSYGTSTTSTVGRLNFYDSANEPERLGTLLNGQSFGGTPYLHFYMRTSTDPTIKIYMGKDIGNNDVRRDLHEDYRNTNGEWVLIAVKLTDFLTSPNPNNFHLRTTPNRSDPVIPKSVDYDWFIITDKVLTEFGALDYSDTTTSNRYWDRQ